MSDRKRPPILEIFVPKRDPPLHRWDSHADWDETPQRAIKRFSTTKKPNVVPEPESPLSSSVSTISAPPRKPKRSSETPGSPEGEDDSSITSPKLPVDLETSQDSSACLTCEPSNSRTSRDSSQASNMPVRSSTTDETPRKPVRSPPDQDADWPPFLSKKLARPASRSPPKRTDSFLGENVTIPDIKLIPVSFESSKDLGKSEGGPAVKEGVARVLQSVVADRLQAHAEKDVTVLFCIRRAGCGQCREHGMQLAEIVEDSPNVDLIGVLKETGVDDEALHDFYAKYFKFPLFKDETWDLFVRACGNKKVTIWSFLKFAPRLTVRYNRKNIQNIPFGGDHFTSGGVLIFDKQQRLRFVYYERYGHELDMEAISWAIEQARIPLDSLPTAPTRKSD